jgi:hypothetical protein
MPIWNPAGAGARRRTRARRRRPGGSRRWYSSTHRSRGRARRLLRVELVHVPVAREIGEEAARHDAVDPHLRPERVRERDRHRVHPGLRGGVGDDAAVRPDRTDAAHVDDRPSLPRGHARADERGQAERPLQVHGEHLVVEFLRDVGDPVVDGRHARIVDEHVDLFERPVGGVRESIEVRPAADVTGVRERVATGLGLDLARELLAALEPPARDHDVGTGAREGEHHLPSHPAAAAGDERHLAGEIEELCCGLGRCLRHLANLVVAASSAALRAMSRTTSPNAAIFGLSAPPARQRA